MINNSSQSPVMNDQGGYWSGIFAKINEYVRNYKSAANMLRWMMRPDTTPFIDELAASHGTYYNSHDSRKEVRQAMSETPALQRAPGAFSSWKNSIDRITGGDAKLYPTYGDTGYKLSSSFTVGISRVGSGDELGPFQSTQPYNLRLFEPGLGNVMIDLNCESEPPADVVAAVARKLAPLGNIYMFVEIGVLRDFAYGAFTIGENIVGDVNYTIGSTTPSSAGTYFVPLARITP